MTFLQPAIALIATTCLLSCTKDKSSAATPRPAGHQVHGWPGKEYDRVVGYQFFNPHGPFREDSPVLGDEVRGEQLTKVKRKEVVLKPDQTTRLLKSALFSSDNGAPAACYYPHHIFVFYKGDAAVAAIEVCFHCNGKKTWPPAENAVGTDYPALATLSGELGLGTDMPEDEKKVEWPDPFGLPPPPKP